MKSLKCECCGKEGMTKELDHCYGCGHIICINCTEDVSGIHTLENHKRAHPCARP